MKIEGKTAIVTGGGQGFGEKFCIGLLDKGANVVIADIKTNPGQDLSDQLNRKYGSNRTRFIKCDVASESDFQKLINVTKSTYGYVDILCNNAGVAELDDWTKVIDINLTAVIRGTKLAMEVMSTRNGGRGGIIVNTASMGGLFPMPDAPVYSASKYGVVGFTRSMDCYYATDGIRINAICPSFSPTNLFLSGLHELRKAGREEEAKAKEGLMVSLDQVARGLVQMVEDDTKNGAIMRITVAKGIDYKIYRSSKL